MKLRRKSSATQSKNHKRKNIKAREVRVDVFSIENGYDWRQALPPMGFERNGHLGRMDLRDIQILIIGPSSSSIR